MAYKGKTGRAASRARRADSKKRRSRSSSSRTRSSGSRSSGSSKGRSSSNPDKYRYEYGGRSYENKADATAASRADGGRSSSRVGHVEKQAGTYVRPEKEEVVEDKIEEKFEDKGGKGVPSLNSLGSFRRLSKDQQEAVRKVYQIIAENDVENAERLKAAFDAAAEIAEPYFKQKLLVARDAIERGFQNIAEDSDFKEKQLRRRHKELKEDLLARQEFLSLEETAALKAVEREYDESQKTIRQNLAARGFTSSSQRIEKEDLLEETTGELRETHRRRFGVQKKENERKLERGEIETQSEIDRLTELTKRSKMKLFRESETTLGTAGLGGLGVDIDPLGGIVGDIPQQQTEDIISGATNLMF